MNLLESILSNQDGATVKQMAKNFGLGEQETKSALEQLVPAVARGVQKRASGDVGLEELLGALKKGNHQRYIDNPASLSDKDTEDDGKSILGHIFDNNKDVSRNVAGHAAEKTGLSAGLLKKMLPVVAALAMGALGKKGATGGLLGMALGGGKGMLAGLLTSFLDADKDGHIIDDLFSLAKRFF